MEYYLHRPKLVQAHITLGTAPWMFVGSAWVEPMAIAYPI